MALTERKIRDAGPGRHPDGANGLYLNVSKAGTKSWELRFREYGKRVDRGLGSLKTVTLAEARQLAKRNADYVAGVKLLRGAMDRGEVYVAGENDDDYGDLSPFPPQPPTVHDAATVVRDRKVAAGEIHNPKSARNWLQVLERHALPALGHKALGDVTQRDVIGVLEPIWNTLPETAKRVESRLREIFAWGVAYDHAESNPVDHRTLVAALRRPRRDVQHHRALDYADVPEALRTIAGSGGMRETRLCLQWVILTACRSGEARGMRWEELSADWTTWTIPAERSKTGKDHRVPVSVQARALLVQAKAAVPRRLKRRPTYAPDGLVFPHPSGATLSDAALMLRLRKDGIAGTVHGFRTSCRTWIAEKKEDVSWEVAELCLGHAVGNRVARAYVNTDQLELRQPIMQAWADFIQPQDRGEA